MDLLGYVKACLVLGTGGYPHKFYVRARPANRQRRPYDVIIGVDLMAKIGICTIDFVRNYLILKDPNNKAEFVHSFNPKEPRVVIRTSAGQKWKVGGGKTLAEWIRDSRNPSSSTTQHNTSDGRELEHASPDNDGDPDIPIAGINKRKTAPTVPYRIPSKQRGITPPSTSQRPNKQGAVARQPSATPSPGSSSSPITRNQGAAAKLARFRHPSSENAQDEEAEQTSLPPDQRKKAMADQLAQLHEKRRRREAKAAAARAEKAKETRRDEQAKVTMVDILDELVANALAEPEVDEVEHDDVDAFTEWNDNDSFGDLFDELEYLNFSGPDPTGLG